MKKNVAAPDGRGGYVKLGYEVRSGKPVEIPVLHTVITGQSQQAGKTTALEGLAARSGLKTLAFVTKRGEHSFTHARRIDPYFRERADWQFVQSLLEATMRERLKFERSWIMRASKGAKTLADVQRNVRTFLADKKVRGLSADVYLTLDAYLDIVVPRLARMVFADKLDLRPGVNVLDMSNRQTFPSELQSLVMRSAIDWIHEHESGVVTVIPEAWEFIPQSRGSPVKLSAAELIRKGASLGNYVWLDSQDIAGVDKELLRQCPVWLLGVQREANEIKRVLANIPAGIAKPTASQVALLERGQFFACWGQHVVKTYVQPAWMDSDLARQVAATGVPPPSLAATGELVGEVVLDSARMAKVVDATRTLLAESEVDGVYPLAEHAANVAKQIAEQEEDDDMTKDQEAKLDTILSLMENAQQARTAPPPDREVGRDGVARTIGDEEALYQRIRARLLKDKQALAVALSVPIIEVETVLARLKVDGKTALGRAALLVRDGFFDKRQGAPAATVEINKRGGNFERITVYKALEELCEKGFLYREQLSDRSVVYTGVAGMHKNIDEKCA